MAKDDGSHEDIWDDSALVASWQGAFEEYKKYHSLAAKGEDVEVVLEKASHELHHDNDSVNMIEKHAKNVNKPLQANGDGGKAASIPQSTAVETPIQSSAAPSAQPTPQALLHVQDEGLRNVMMSWYYAGYYTGLYEGQQKAYASMQDGG